MLDALRGAAALYVVAYHSINVLTVHTEAVITEHEPFRALLHGNPFWFGRYAVIVFFVLSGFVIHLRQAQRPAKHGGEWLSTYAWRRGVRIYPPLIAALLLTLVIGIVGQNINDSFFGNPPSELWNVVDNHNLGPVYAAGNLIPAGYLYGSNLPLWSVQYEIWFYVAYAVLLLVVIERLRIPARVVVPAIMATGLAAGLYVEVVGMPGPTGGMSVSFPIFLVIYFPCWLVGFVLAELYARGVIISRPAILTVGSAILIGTLAYFADNRAHGLLDFMWAIGIAGLMASVLLVPSRVQSPSRLVAFLVPTAAWSYSLYLVHFPILLLVRAVWIQNHDIPFHSGLAALGSAIAITGGITVWLIVERPVMHFLRTHPNPPTLTTLRSRSSRRSWLRP